MHSAFLIFLGMAIGAVLVGVIVLISDLWRMPLILDDSDEPF